MSASEIRDSLSDLPEGERTRRDDRQELKTEHLPTVFLPD